VLYILLFLLVAIGSFLAIRRSRSSRSAKQAAPEAYECTYCGERDCDCVKKQDRQ
jgi:hypothetical protein